MLLVADFAFAETTELEAFVSTEKAFIWTQPGYSWADCRPLEPKEPENKFKSKQDETLTMSRFNAGAKRVCQMRDKKRDLLSAGDSVEILTRNGKMVTESHDIIISGELMKKQFYLVNYRGQMGWMSEDQITEPAPKEYARPKASKDTCVPGSKSANPMKGMAIQIPELQKAIDKHIALGTPKTDREVDRFACLYRSNHIDDDEFPGMYKKFQVSAKQASKAFGIPYGLIMCTMLVESGLHYNPKEKKEYKGLPQFGSALVSDLNKVKDREPYSQMWGKYQKMNPKVELSDRAVRSSPDPTAPAAAIALAYQWMYWDRIKQSRCKDCSFGSQINRKELYMLVTGYNWGPYSIGKVAGKSAYEMQSTPPPPKESRDYMVRMEHCLEGGYDQSFRDEAPTKVSGKKSKDKSKTKEKSKSGKKSKAKKAIVKAFNQVTHRNVAERKVYEDRVDECDRLYPVK
jgi:hypothetical protein